MRATELRAVTEGFQNENGYLHFLKQLS